MMDLQFLGIVEYLKINYRLSSQNYVPSEQHL